MKKGIEVEYYRRGQNDFFRGMVQYDEYKVAVCFQNGIKGVEGIRARDKRMLLVRRLMTGWMPIQLPTAQQRSSRPAVTMYVPGREGQLVRFGRRNNALRLVVS